MRTVRTVAELREALVPHRRAGRCIGLVPTMGAFHDGHLSLMRRARAENDVVVVSLFVNPAQFGPGEDLAAYPRDDAGDAAAAKAEGVDFLFVPPHDEVYPPGFATEVKVGALTEPLEGTSRGPQHFHGVTTVVTKLFNMVSPDAAYFGQKDVQQAAVIRKLVRDLDFPVRIEICPIVREPDGLAMSSRNRYLAGADRERAIALSRALVTAREAAEAGERDAKAIVAKAKAAMVEHGVEPEYLELVSTDTLSPVEEVGDADVLVAVAARVGPARLIDNTVIHANGRH
ncbi:MAG: pantoate--beta-alanine ligase [Solirubrobacteraceae bacterium]